MQLPQQHHGSSWHWKLDRALASKSSAAFADIGPSFRCKGVAAYQTISYEKSNTLAVYLFQTKLGYRTKKIHFWNHYTPGRKTLYRAVQPIIRLISRVNRSSLGSNCSINLSVIRKTGAEILTAATGWSDQLKIGAATQRTPGSCSSSSTA